MVNPVLSILQLHKAPTQDQPLSVTGRIYNFGQESAQTIFFLILV